MAAPGLPNAGSGSLDGVRIGQLGHFDPDYARNRILRKALVRAGAEVFVLSDTRAFLLRAPALVKAALRGRFDLLLVGFPGHSDVPLARLAARQLNIPLLFDAFVSLYDANVEDRGTARRGSLSAWRYYVQDRLSCALADRVLLDTHANAEYFTHTFHLPVPRFRRVWAGADDDVMIPEADRDDEAELRVFFYGKFLPLHGVEHIVEAAQLLQQRGEPVNFTVVGGGQTFTAVREEAARAGLRNFQLPGFAPYADLPGLMARSDVCLGLFGTTGRCRRVIPNKAFDALAVRRTLVSADTPAIREALVHGETAYLCQAGSGAALAEALTTLRRDPELRRGLARDGRTLFERAFSIGAISMEMSRIVRELLDDLPSAVSPATSRTSPQ